MSSIHANGDVQGEKAAHLNYTSTFVIGNALDSKSRFTIIGWERPEKFVLMSVRVAVADAKEINNGMAARIYPYS